MPTPNDRPTIGYGATFNADGSPVRMGQVWTQAQADDAFDHDIQKYGDKVAALIGDDPTTPAQFGAMTALAYNIGLGAFGNSTVLRMHREGKFQAAADAFLMWSKQAGKVLAGLTRRRAAERALYLS
jgi:GH24 family phage-related lysozyme (muramidase)